jgi:hypothetical protein
LLAIASLVPIETTVSNAAFAQQGPLPALPPPPAGNDTGPEAPPPAAEPASPAASSPSPPARVKTVRVHVVTNATAVQVFFRVAPDPTSSAAPGEGKDIRQYSASCLAPCDLDLAPDAYFVALSRAGGRAYEQPTPLALTTATTVEATYESHSGARVAGIVLLSTLVPIGAVVALVGATAGTSTCSFNGSISQCTGGDAVPGLVAVGLVTLGVGVVFGTVFVLRRDDTAVQVVGATGAISVHGTWTERPSAANGLALRFSF